MRYAPAERLLRLAKLLAATRTGLTLDEIAAALEVKRRTAERLRDSLAAIFPQLESEDGDDRSRRWRLPAQAVAGIVTPQPETIAAVETAATELAARGEAPRAVLLRDAAATLRTMFSRDVLRRAEPDIEALMEAEGTALRPGPRPTLQPGLLETLRTAILSMHRINILYGPTGGPPTPRCLCPHGILYGGRGWLVARVADLPEMRLWRLDRIHAITLSNQPFTPARGFSLKAYAAQSFGVFQEQPHDVELRFRTEAAEDAAAWCFHPTQTVTSNADGTLTVRFRAASLREMAWHLFTWGETVDIVGPASLRDTLAAMAARVARHHAPAPEPD